MKLFGNRYRYALILILASYSYLNSLFLEVFAFYHIEEPAWLIWIAFMLIVALVWEGNRLIEQLIRSKSTTKNVLLIQFMTSTLAAALAGWLVPVAINGLYANSMLDPRDIHIKLSIAFSLRVNLFLQCINAFLHFINRARQKEIEAVGLREAAAKSELELLKNQVNPHFLFNNLNVLSSLVINGNKEANTFIESFSSVYRQILQAKDKDLISLREESSILEPYTFLLSKRFGEALKIHQNIPDACMDKLIVPTSLQLLVENAIKHNVVTQQKPLHIYITANPGTQELKVMNPLQPKLTDEPSSKTGLKNIAERYKYATGKTIGVNGGTDAFEVRLPLIES